MNNLTSLFVSGGVLIPDPNIKKEYDLVYSNQGGQWNDFARNWTLAKASIITLVQELNFKVPSSLTLPLESLLVMMSSKARKSNARAM